jgi:hypothetical protein
MITSTFINALALLVSKWALFVFNTDKGTA